MAEEAAEATPVPMEDTVEALIDHLVAPLLPLRDLKTPPTVEQQRAVAKQMHSVVLLYNYFHRKQFPQLEFLSFDSVCKAAAIAKPSILSYMNFILHKDEKKGCLDEQLSVVEKMIMSACNISSTLDISKSAPNMDGWPISGVAIFLVDYNKEKCFLEFSSSTQGVWSLVEKEFDRPTANLVGSCTKMKTYTSKSNKSSNRSSDESSEKENALQQLAFSTIQQMTGISQSYFSILESHLTYSLSQEKSATRLYIIECPEAVNTLSELSIEHVLNSSRGPVIDLTHKVTSVVEYYHLLPYLDILSDWQSKKTHGNPSPVLLRQQVDSNQECAMISGIGNMDNHKNGESSENNEILVATRVKKSRSGLEGNDREANELTIEEESAKTNFTQLDVVDSCTEPDMLPTVKNQTSGDKIIMNGKSTETNCFNFSNTSAGESYQNGLTVAISEPLSKIHDISLFQLQKASSDIDATAKHFINLKSCNTKRGSDFIEQSMDAVNDGTNKVGLLNLAKKSRLDENKDGGSFAKRGIDQTNQHAVTAIDLQIVPVQSKVENQDEIQFVSINKNDLLQASLCILQKRRNDLCQQQRALEDEIAQCEMNIQMMLSGGESKDESIIEACNLFCSSQVEVSKSFSPGVGSHTQETKIKRLTEAVLSKSSCQELDDICCQNGWTLPRYSVLPSISDGSFHASVVIKGIEFECTIHGDSQIGPHEARLSAAAGMLGKLRAMASQALQSPS